MLNNAEVTIVFIPSTQGQIDYRFFTPDIGNNISAEYLNIDLQSFYEGARPFILGASQLNGGDVYWDTSVKYNGYMGGKLSSNNGLVNVKIVINGTNIDNFVLRFDKVAEQWATEINVDNVLFINDDAQFVWKGESSNSHTILIQKWNKPLYPVRVTSLSVGLTLKFDRSNIKEIVRGSQTVVENNQPSYGTISQYGSVEIYDNDGELLDLDELGLLLPNQNIEIKLNDEIIGKFYSENWNIDNDIAKVELTDKIIKWQDILFEGYQLRENDIAENLFNRLNNLSGYEVHIVSNTFLKNTHIKYDYLDRSTLAEAWLKFCEITQTNIYQKENGEIWLEKL